MAKRRTIAISAEGFRTRRFRIVDNAMRFASHLLRVERVTPTISIT